MIRECLTITHFHKPTDISFLVTCDLKYYMQYTHAMSRLREKLILFDLPLAQTESGTTIVIRNIK